MYIVFKTTNLLSGKYYIGVHETDNPDVWDYYLGDSIYSNNPKTYIRRKTPLQRAVAVFGVKNFRRSTIKCFDNIEDALKLERMIKNPRFWQNSDVYNIEIPRMTNIYEFSLHGKKLRMWSTIEEISKYYNLDLDTVKLHVISRSPYKEKLWSLSQDNSIPKSNRIRQYTTSGLYIRTFSNSKEASKILDIDRREINNAIYGKHKVCGYYFLLEGEDIRNYPNRNRPVYQYTLNGEFVKQWSNSTEVKLTLKINKGRLKRAMKNRKPVGGYYWDEVKYTNFFIDNPEVKCRKAIKVYQYTMDDKLVEEWESISKCRKKYPLALDVCLGKLHSCDNFKFSFNKLMI